MIQVVVIKTRSDVWLGVATLLDFFNRGLLNYHREAVRVGLAHGRVRDFLRQGVT